MTKELLTQWVSNQKDTLTNALNKFSYVIAINKESKKYRILHQ
jgi:hypothetical protein